jgi:hypothetical protein
MKHLNLSTSGCPFPDAILIELGRITVCRARLDRLLSDTLKTLIHMDEYLNRHHAIGCPAATFAQRVEVFGAYCAQLAQEYPHLTSYRQVLEKLRGVQVLHDRFTRDGLFAVDNSGVCGSSQRQDADCPREEMTPEDLRRASRRIAEAHEALHAFGLQVGNAVQTEKVRIEIRVHAQ